VLSRLVEEGLALTPGPRPLAPRLTVQEPGVLEGEERAAGAFGAGEEEGVRRFWARREGSQLAEDVLVADDAGHAGRVQGRGKGVRHAEAGASQAGV
jgi:hypothetical protein